MAKAKRVFEIAKELGVTSKAIVSKCHAEGVPGITNHMSTVKLGLVQTITEWFNESSSTEGSSHTAVEVAEKVDLSKARAKRRRNAASVKAGAVLEQVSTETIPTTTEVTTTLEEVQEEVRQLEEVVSEVVEEDPDVKAPSPPEVEEETPEVTEPEPTVEEVVAPVKPAGVPLGKPKEATLKGPRLVRMEKPESVSAPRPRRSGAAPAASESDNVLGLEGGGSAGASRSRGPARGKGAGSDSEADARGGGKRRSQSTRRGRTADALPVGPSKFSEQDLIELDARLNRATGFLKQRRRQMTKQSGPGGAAALTPAVQGGRVEIAEPVTIKALSATTGIKSADVIKYLFKKGIMATINSAIDAEAAMEVALEYGIELEVKEQQTAEEMVLEEFENRAAVDARPRPPVVTVLGHVDHGKTSLLDRIRAADVADHEAGGITQHVGAHRVTIQGHEGEQRTAVFLDTPGHEAFTSMRARGAKMTDLVVLVVAADDGVMPQTVESINHAKAAGVPIIVALNKIDKAEATDENLRKIYGQLAEQGLNPVEWGGTTEVVKVSATDGTGINELLELLDYQSELLELKADYGGSARGTVIETQIQPGRGPVARILVQQGRLAVGDFIVIGRAFGRVRDMTDDRGHALRRRARLRLSNCLVSIVSPTQAISFTLPKRWRKRKTFRCSVERPNVTDNWLAGPR